MGLLFPAIPGGSLAAGVVVFSVWTAVLVVLPAALVAWVGVLVALRLLG